MNNIYFNKRGDIVELTPEEEKTILSHQSQVVIFKNNLRALTHLSIEQKGLIMDAIMQERLDGEPATINDKLASAIYQILKDGFEDADRMYIKRTVEKEY